AEERGKKSAMTAAAARLVKAEFRAAGAGRDDQETLDGFLELADPQKFVDENGEPNEKAIQAAIGRLAPKSDSGAGRAGPDLKSAALPAGEAAPSSASDWMRRQVSR